MSSLTVLNVIELDLTELWFREGFENFAVFISELGQDPCRTEICRMEAVCRIEVTLAPLKKRLYFCSLFIA